MPYSKGPIHWHPFFYPDLSYLWSVLPTRYDTPTTGRIFVPSLCTLEQVVGSLYGRNKGGNDGDGERHSDPPPRGGGVGSAAAVVAEWSQRGGGGSALAAARRQRAAWQRCWQRSSGDGRAVAAQRQERGGGSVAVVV